MFLKKILTLLFIVSLFSFWLIHTAVADCAEPPTPWFLQNDTTTYIWVNLGGLFGDLYDRDWFALPFSFVLSDMWNFKLDVMNLWKYENNTIEEKQILAEKYDAIVSWWNYEKVLYYWIWYVPFLSGDYVTWTQISPEWKNYSYTNRLATYNFNLSGYDKDIFWLLLSGFATSFPNDASFLLYNNGSRKHRVEKSAVTNKRETVSRNLKNVMLVSSGGVRIITIWDMWSNEFYQVDTSNYYADDTICERSFCYWSDHVMLEGNMYTWVTLSDIITWVENFLQQKEMSIDTDMYASMLFDQMMWSGRFERFYDEDMSLGYNIPSCNNASSKEECEDTAFDLWPDVVEIEDCDDLTANSSPECHRRYKEVSQKRKNKLYKQLQFILLSDWRVLFYVPWSSYNSYCGDGEWFVYETDMVVLYDVFKEAIIAESQQPDYEEMLVIQDHYAIINRLFQNSITKHSTINDFMPQAPIRRDEMAAFLDRWYTSFQNEILWMTSKNAGTFDCWFDDLSLAHTDLLATIIDVCDRGIFKWWKGKFMPRDFITNEQALAVIMRQMISIDDATWESRSQSYYDHEFADQLIDWTSFLNKKESATRIDVWQVLRRALLLKLMEKW